MGYAIYEKDYKIASNANEVKALLMRYFRFKRNYLGVGVEVHFAGKDIEDFVAFNKDEAICIEIKTSKSDFLADFKNKEKHERNKHYFQKFYFCVIADMEAWALEKLKELDSNGKYGLMVADSKIRVAKRAGILQKLRLNDLVFQSLVHNMSKELTKAYTKLYLKDGGVE